MVVGPPPAGVVEEAVAGVHRLVHVALHQGSWGRNGESQLQCHLLGVTSLGRGLQPSLALAIHIYINHIKSPCLICASLRLSPGLILYSAMLSHTGLTSPLPKVLLAAAATGIGGAGASVVAVFVSPVLMWPRSSKNILYMLIIQDVHDYSCKTFCIHYFNITLITS